MTYTGVVVGVGCNLLLSLYDFTPSPYKLIVSVNHGGYSAADAVSQAAQSFLPAVVSHPGPKEDNQVLIHLCSEHLRIPQRLNSDPSILSEIMHGMQIGNPAAAVRMGNRMLTVGVAVGACNSLIAGPSPKALLTLHCSDLRVMHSSHINH